MYRKRMALLSLSLLVPLLLGSLLFDAVSARRTANGPPAAPIVDTLADEKDGSCEDGDCSLRDAISEAPASVTITFNVEGTIVVSPTLGDLDIGKDLTIDGGGVITVSGDNNVRVFNVTAGNVTFDSLTIANGNVQTTDCGAASFKCGGGIILQNSGVAVTVTNSTLSGNSAGLGGGIFISGTVTVSNSTFSGNSADFEGGGISNRGILTVTHSTFSGNSAEGGGGINNYEGTSAITNSTLSGNSAEFGGGIDNYSGTLTVTNSTLSGNSADYGGGIYIENGTARVDNSTLSDNRAGTSGGGISSYGDSLTFTTIGNTIVSGNVISGTTTIEADDLALAFDITNSFSSGGYNLIGAIGDNITSITATGDITNTLPLLGPLADNGGDTFTRALLPGSLAIDNGLCIGGPAADQRGVARPPEGSCDSGAFESRGFSLTLTSGSPQATIINTPFANPLALIVSSTFKEPVEGGQVAFSAPASGASVTFTETVETIGSGGLVSLPVTANGTVGSYQVSANAIGNNGVGLSYNLTNVVPLYEVFLPVVIK